MFVVGAVDTIAIEIRRPKDNTFRRVAYHGKYKAFVIKFLVVCDFHGRICFVDGPFVGTRYDAHLFIRSMQSHPMHPLELLLGDGHFVSLPQIIGPKRKPRNGVLSFRDRQWNSIVAKYRSRFAFLFSIFSIFLQFSFR